MLQRRVGADTGERATRAELLRQLGDVQRARARRARDLGRRRTRKRSRPIRATPGPAPGFSRSRTRAPTAPAAVGVLLGALRACDDWQALLELTAHRLLAASTDDARLAVLLEAAEIVGAARGRRRPGLRGDAARVRDRARQRARPGRDRPARGVAGAWSRPRRRRTATPSTARPATTRRSSWRCGAKIGSVLETRRDDQARRARGVPARARGRGRRHARRGRDAAEVGSAAVRVAGKLAEWSVARGCRGRPGARTVGAAPRESLAMLERGRRGRRRVGRGDARARRRRDVGSAARRGRARRRSRAPPSCTAIGGTTRTRPRPRSSGRSSTTRRTRACSPRSPTSSAAPAGRPLVGTLLRLSRATSGDFALLQEASEVASETRGGPAARALDRHRVARARPEPLDRPSTRSGVTARARRPSRGWAIERLARLHAQDEDSRAVLEVLVAGDALPFDAAVRRDLRRRAARLALDPLGDDERAIALYGSLFDEDPLDAEAVGQLASTYARHGRTRDLLSLRERQIASVGDIDAAHRAPPRGRPAARGARRQRASHRDAAREPARSRAPRGHGRGAGRGPRSRRQERRASRPPRRGKPVWPRPRATRRAPPSSGRAPRFWPRSGSTIPTRRRGTTRAWWPSSRAPPRSTRSRVSPTRGATMRPQPSGSRSSSSIVGPEQRTAATLRLGEALVSAGQPERAAERLDASLRVDPEAEPVRARLATLYREQSAWPELARLVAGSAAHAPDKATKMARLLEAARLHADRCGEPEAAIPLLEQASDLAPEDQAVRLGLADALANARRFDEASAILQSMIDAFGGRRPKERAPVHYQIARLQLSMGNRARALVELDTATRVDPQNPEILRALAELARDDGQLDRAEKSYRALLVVLRRREDTRRAGVRIARSEVLLELSAIAERHGEGDRAKEILESAIETGAQSDFEQERLEGALRARGDDDTLVRVLESKLGRLADSPAGRQGAWASWPTSSPSAWGARSTRSRSACARWPWTRDRAPGTTRRSRSREPSAPCAGTWTKPGRSWRPPSPLATCRSPARSSRASGRWPRPTSRTIDGPRPCTSAPSISDCARPSCSVRSIASTAASATPTSKRGCSRSTSRPRRSRAARAPPPTRSTGSPPCGWRRARRSTRAPR